MIVDKPHIVYFMISIIAGIIILIFKLPFLSALFERPTMGFVNVLVESLPVLFGSILFLALAYWFMAVFKKPTHPVLNILQLISVFLAYFGIVFIKIYMMYDTGTDNFLSTSFMISFCIMITLPYVSLAFLVLNVIYSLVKPNE